MTIEEFRDSVTDFDSLKEFCDEYDYDRYVANIYDEDSIDRIICDEIKGLTEYEMWYIIRDRLDEIPRGYYYYRHDGGLNLTALDDDDIRGIIEELYEELIDNGFFEETDDTDEEEEEEDTDVDAVVHDEWTRCDKPAASPGIIPVTITQNVQKLLFG